MLDLSGLEYDKNGGLITVVTQDAASGMVLMVAHADREAVERTLASGEMHYFSRTRGAVAQGSDERQHAARRLARRRLRRRRAARARRAEWSRVSHGLRLVLRRARSPWATRCSRSTRRLPDAPQAPRWTTPTRRTRRSRRRVGAEEQSYTVQLLEDRNLRLKKLGEEAAELIAACADGDLPRATEEVADLLYHALVALRAAGGSLSDVQRVLAKRATPAMPPRKEEPKDDPKSKKRR